MKSDAANEQENMKPTTAKMQASASPMEAIILAGGLGARLRPLVSDRPKPLALVNGVPFLHLLLRRLASQGFGRVILATGYMGEMIHQSVGSEFAGMEIAYSHESEPLGTGGALRLALGLCRNDHVTAMNGDTWLEVEFEELEKLWHQERALIMTGAEAPDSARFGRLCVEDGLVAGMKNDINGAGLVSCGCYILPAGLFADWRGSGKFSFENDFLPQYLARQPAVLYKKAARFHDIGTPEDYLRFGGGKT